VRGLTGGWASDSVPRMPGSMTARIEARLRRLFSRPAPDASPIGRPVNLPLPPNRLRAGGVHFRADRDFLASAVAEADRVVRDARSARPFSLLDIGCGAGRLAYGLLAAGSPVARYEGIDVMPAPIAWCEETISGRYPTFRFGTIDVYNERYNPDGSRQAAGTSLPFEDGSFDVIYAYSVFSHMLTDDVRAYLGEVARVMARDGVGIVTAFVEDGVPEEEVNPPGYQGLEWRGALHCVRFSRGHFEAMAGAAGLRVASFEHGRETDGQSRILFEQAPAGGRL
jgi:SAM-dependent methyltransferase